MDIKTLVGSVLSEENLAALTQKTGLGTDQVQSVVGKAVPFLANGENSKKGEDEAVRAIAAEAGTTDGETKSILTEAAPLLMGLLGGSSGNEQAGSTGGSGDMIGMLMGLLGNADLGGMMGGMFGGSQEAPQEQAQEESSGGLLGGLLGGLFKKN